MKSERLTYRRPTVNDAQAMFERYASDAEVTRYLGWPRHRAVDATRAFVLEISEPHWATWGTGPLLAFDGETLVGSTGLAMEAEHHATTGYVVVKEEWGKGYATEMARVMVDLAFARPKVRRLSALTHADHTASGRVLEKAGFAREGRLRRYFVFPNLGEEPYDVNVYARAVS